MVLGSQQAGENVDYQFKRLELASEFGTHYNQAPLPACTCGKPALQSGSACQRRQQKLESRLQGAISKAAQLLSTTGLREAPRTREGCAFPKVSGL